MRDFAERLRQRVATLRLSNAELARRMGLSDQRLGNYLAGIREPDLEMLTKLASMLQTTPNELLGFPDKTGEEQLAALRERAHEAINELGLDELKVIVSVLDALT